MNLLKRLRSPRNTALEKYAGDNKLAMQKALVRLLDRTIVFDPQKGGSTTAKPYEVTLRQDLEKQLAKEPEAMRMARRNSKYGHINSQLELHGMLTSSFFKQLVADIALEVGIPIEDALPIIWESLINEIKTDTNLEEGELVAQAFERQMRDVFAFDERYRRAWDAAIETGDLNAMAEIMGGSFQNTDFSKAGFEAPQESTGLLPEGTK